MRWFVLVNVVYVETIYGFMYVVNVVISESLLYQVFVKVFDVQIIVGVCFWIQNYWYLVFGSCSVFNSGLSAQSKQC